MKKLKTYAVATILAVSILPNLAAAAPLQASDLVQPADWFWEGFCFGYRGDNWEVYVCLA